MSPGRALCRHFKYPQRGRHGRMPFLPAWVQAEVGLGGGSPHFGVEGWMSVLLKFFRHIPMYACIVKTNIKKKPLDLTLDKCNRCNRADKCPMSQELYFYLSNACIRIFLNFCS